MLQFFKKIIKSIALKFQKKYYFIGVVRTTVNEKTGEDEDSDSRCFGFYRSLKTAIKAVTENWTDLNEFGYYQYAVIEPHYEGLCSPVIGETLWFKQSFSLDLSDEILNNPTLRVKDSKTNFVTWTTEENGLKCVNSNFEGYVRCDEPSFAKHVIGWTF